MELVLTYRLGTTDFGVSSKSVKGTEIEITEKQYCAKDAHSPGKLRHGTAILIELTGNRPQENAALVLHQFHPN